MLLSICQNNQVLRSSECSSLYEVIGSDRDIYVSSTSVF